MKLVNDYGIIVRMSDRSYRRFLKAGADGSKPSASDFGRVVGTLDFTATDVAEDDFRMALDALSL